MATPATFPVLSELGDILLASFDDIFGRYPAIYTRYTQTIAADRTPETIQPLMYFGELISNAIGGATTFQEPAEAYKSTVSVETSQRALGFQVHELAVKLDRSGRVRRAAEKLAVSANHTKETIAAVPLNAAITTAHATRAVPLVSNSQPLFGGGTYDNRIDGDLSVAVFESAMIQFANMVDERGLKINVKPAYLIHTPNDRRVAKQLLGSDKEPFHAENQMNVYRNVVEPIENPWLTDTDNAFLVSASGENGLILAVWQDVRRRSWIDEDTDTLKFKATFHGLTIAGGADWRGLVGIIGA